MPPSCPVRWNAHAPSPEEYGEILARRNRLGEPLPKEATHEYARIQVIRLSHHPPTAEDLRAWLWHPDERVVTQALGSFARGYAQQAEETAAHLRLRIHEARETGELWNLVLDRFASMGLWQAMGQAGHLTAEEADLTPWMEAFDPWLGEHSTPSLMDNLAEHFHTPLLRHRIARFAQRLGGETVLLLSQEARYLRPLFANPHLGQEERVLLCQSLASQVETHPSRAKEFQEPLLKKLRSLAREPRQQALFWLLAAAQGAPRWFFSLWREGALHHPEIPPRELLSLLLSSEAADVRLEAMRLVGEPEPPPRRQR